MQAIPSLESILPEYFRLAKMIAMEIESGAHKGWDTLIPKMASLIVPDRIDAMDAILPGWSKVATTKNGQTAKHTTLVLATCLNLPEYHSADSSTRHEIEWAALLHDIDKGEGGAGDAAHPFRSASVASKIMRHLKFPFLASADDLNAWSDLVLRSQKPDGDRMLHDHTHLNRIVDELRNLCGEGTSSIRILKAVLFHQSLPTLKDWTNPVLLTDAELRSALTLKDMDVLGPILIADSDSWNIFDEPRFAYLNELRENITKTKLRLMGNG